MQDTKEFLTGEELAKRWQMSKDTLANWRLVNKGPPWIKPGGGTRSRVLYKMEDILAFEAEYVSNKEKK